MEVSLDAPARTVSGVQRITWRNTTARPTSEVRLHLYLNAFRDHGSTLMRESDDAFRERWRDGEFGSVELTELRLEGASGQDLRPEFVSPDDGNADDRTVVRAVLPAPVAPGATVTLSTRFMSRLPKAYRRTGWLPGDGFFCMHWYPKLGVLEERDGAAVWNCHQFHANTEFFADFSTYDVSISVPADFVVGATGGHPVETRDVGDRRVWRFRCDDVHDFAWVADPHFRVVEDSFGPFVAAEDPSGVAQAVARELGVPVGTFDLPATAIRLLIRPEHDDEEQVRRHLDAVKCGLEFFGLRFGPYPYPAITVVDPGRDMMGHGLGGGMEYPTLITCGTALFPHPRALRPEGVTVHEFGHQYWYGLSANNEFEESWLDEGINTFSEGRALDLHYRERMQPLRTSSYGLLTVGRVAAPIDPPRGALGWSRLPGLDLLPEAARARLDALGFDGTVVPESALLDLLAAQPTATGFTDASFENALADRARMLSVDNPDPMVRPGWRYVSRDSYSANSYTRPATLLATLERLVGRDEWWAFMRRFHARARFSHPTTGEFVKALGNECGDAAAALFEAATAAGAVFDYGIHSVSPADGKGPRKRVVVRRYGGVRSDVRIRFVFAGRDAAVDRVFAAGVDEPWLEFTFDADEQGRQYGDLLEVWVDPPAGTPGSGEPFEVSPGVGVHLLDANLLNNGWRARPDPAPALYRGIRALLQAQSQLTFAGVIG